MHKFTMLSESHNWNYFLNIETHYLAKSGFFFNAINLVVPLGLQQRPSVTHWAPGPTLLQLGTSFLHGVGSVSSKAHTAASAESGGRQPSVGEQQRLGPKHRWSVSRVGIWMKWFRKNSSALFGGAIRPQGVHWKMFLFFKITIFPVHICTLNKAVEVLVRELCPRQRDN